MAAWNEIYDAKAPCLCNSSKLVRLLRTSHGEPEESTSELVHSSPLETLEILLP